jgi:hypothetical protein
MPIVSLGFPRYRFVDDAGFALASGRVYTYQAGTTTPQTTYTDQSGGTPNTNPVILNARGEASIWMPSGQTFKFVVRTAADADIFTEDNLRAPLSGESVLTDLANTATSTLGDALVGVLQPWTGAIASTVHTWLRRGTINALDFMTTAQADDYLARTETLDLQVPMQAALDAAAANGRTLLLPDGIASIGNTWLRVKSNTWIEGIGRNAVLRRRTGAGIRVIANDDPTNGNSGSRLAGFIVDGNRSGTSDIPARWGGYFSRITDWIVDDCLFRSCDSDGLVYEMAARSSIRNSRATDCNKPGFYLASADYCDLSNLQVWAQVAASTQAAAYQFSNAWFCTGRGLKSKESPFGGILLSRDTRHCTFESCHVENVDTNVEVVPTTYAAYIATQDRPNAAAADGGPSTWGAYDCTFRDIDCCYPDGAAGRVGMRFINSHRHLIEGGAVHEMPDCGIYAVGATDVHVRGTHIFNVGQDPVVGAYAIFGAANAGTNPDRLWADGIHVFDTQGSPTTRGYRNATAAATGARCINSDLRVDTEPLTNGGGSAPVTAYGNRTGTSLVPDTVEYFDGVGERTTVTFPSDANYTVVSPAYFARIIEAGGTLTATRNLVLPHLLRSWVIYNSTGQSIQVIGSTGTGVTIASNRHAVVYSNGTNFVRVTPDTAP